MSRIREATPPTDLALLLGAEEALDDRSLNLILLPTEQCNFRCTYCYEQFPHARMSPETVLAVKRLMDARAPQLRRLSINWFGGEPLLDRQVVEDVSEHACSLAEQNPGLQFRANMTTNGYALAPEILMALVARGVKDYQISLDGPPSHHDVTRIRVNGRGSFDRIWGNLLSAKRTDLDFSILLRVHFSPDNVDVLNELVDMIADSFSGDDRFLVYFKNVERLGGANDDNFRVFGEAEQHAVRDALERRFARPTQIFRLEQDRPYVCYASKVNSLLIRADGSVGKCTVALYDDRNHIGQLLPDGRLQIDRSRLAPWLRGLASLDPETLACPWVAMPPTPTATVDRENRPLLSVLPAPAVR